MSKTIKPIETMYRGYRMRSRLEARWATFFDSLGILWKYEVDGFNIDGRNYLPDFFLPYMPQQHQGWGFWVEIKPVPLSSEQIKLIDGLAKATGHRAYAICGDPWQEQYTVSVFQHYRDAAPASVPLLTGQFYEQHTIIDCKSHFEFGIWSGGKKFQFAAAEAYERTETLGHLSHAFGRARQARFEHNERERDRPPPIIPMPVVSNNHDAEFAACKTEEERHALFLKFFNEARKRQGLAQFDS